MNQFSRPCESLNLQQEALLYLQGGNYTRREVMKDLQYLFNSCYEFGINPLPRIRKCFPAFEWEYYAFPEAQDKSKHIAAKAAMVWRIHLGGYIVATMEDGTRQIDISYITGGDIHSDSREKFSVSNVTGVSS